MNSHLHWVQCLSLFLLIFSHCFSILRDVVFFLQTVAFVTIYSGCYFKGLFCDALSILLPLPGRERESILMPCLKF